jgi:hypothetical protein
MDWNWDWLLGQQQPPQSAQPPSVGNGPGAVYKAIGDSRQPGDDGTLRSARGELERAGIDPQAREGYEAIEKYARARMAETMKPPQLSTGELIGGALQNIGGVVAYAQGNPQFGSHALSNNYITQHAKAAQDHKSQMSKLSGDLAMNTVSNFDKYYTGDLEARRKLKLEAQREVQARREMGLPVSPQLYQAAGMKPDTGPVAPPQQAPQAPPPSGPLPQVPGIAVGEAPQGMPAAAQPSPEPTPLQTGSAPAQAPAPPGNQRAQQVLMEAQLASRLGQNERATMLMNQYNHLTEGDRTEANEVAKVSAREQAARSFNLDPATPEGRAFILTGKMPREDQQPLTATDKKAILEADEMVMSTEAALAAIKEAKELSPKAYEGFAASTRATIVNNTPYANTEAAEATVNYDNAVIGQAVTQLKAIFGGMPTEGERKILIELQGSSSLPHNVRIKILERAEKLAERRLQMNKDRVDQLRGGTFYKPQEPRAAAPERTSTGDTPEAPAPKPPEKKNTFIDDTGGQWTVID